MHDDDDEGCEYHNCSNLLTVNGTTSSVLISLTATCYRRRQTLNLPVHCESASAQKCHVTVVNPQRH